MCCVKLEQESAPNSSSGVSDQQSVGSSPGRDTVSISKTLNHLSFEWDVKLLVPCVVIKTLLSTCVKDPSTHLSQREGVCPGVSGSATIFNHESCTTREEELKSSMVTKRVGMSVNMSPWSSG